MALKAGVDFCGLKRGGGVGMKPGSKPCICEVAPVRHSGAHRCSCGGSWMDDGTVVKPPAFPAIAGWGQ